MRRLSLGTPPPLFADYKTWRKWADDSFREIEFASAVERVHETADAYTPTNVTLTRTFDADTVTTAELADIVGTFLLDLKERGIKRS